MPVKSEFVTAFSNGARVCRGKTGEKAVEFVGFCAACGDNGIQACSGGYGRVLFVARLTYLRFFFRPSGLLRDDLALHYKTVTRYPTKAVIPGKKCEGPSHLSPVFVVKEGLACSMAGCLFLI